MTEVFHKPSILLIDDNPKVLDGLFDKISEILKHDEVEIRTWLPKIDDGNPFRKF